VVGLIGTNGAGKTTFINMITGYLQARVRGSIRYERARHHGAGAEQIARLGICRSFQIPQLYSSLLSVYENIHGGGHRAVQLRNLNERQMPRRAICLGASARDVAPS